MKTLLPFLFFALLMESCTSEEARNVPEYEIVPQEIQLEDQEPVITYPINITQRNFKEQFVGSEQLYSTYDSLEITQVNDSNYFFQYFKNGRARPARIDTLVLPEVIRSQTHDSTVYLGFSPFSGGTGQSLYVVEIDGKSYKVIESRSSCCEIWQPRGHMHQGTQSYFSLDFGPLGSFNLRESKSSKALCTADSWDHELVNQLIDSLPLAYDKFQSPFWGHR